MSVQSRDRDSQVHHSTHLPYRLLKQSPWLFPHISFQVFLLTEKLLAKLFFFFLQFPVFQNSYENLFSVFMHTEVFYICKRKICFYSSSPGHTCDNLFNIKEIIFTPTLIRKTLSFCYKASAFPSWETVPFFFSFWLSHVIHNIQFHPSSLSSTSLIFLVTLCPRHHNISSWLFFVSLQWEVLLLVVFTLLFGRLTLLIIYVWGHILILHQIHLDLGFYKDLSYSRAIILQGQLCLS